MFGSCYLDPRDGKVKKASSSYQLKKGTRQDEQGYTTPVGGIGSVASDRYDGQFRGDWQFVEGSGSLDICNGMTVNGQYGYYVTDSFPWVMGCYKGTPDDSFSMGDGPRGRGHKHPPRKP
ncbi:YHYH protein [Veronia nyctiphanis]|uniref:YHYH protein n=1 Tax=Veronia nyctiphanis TaxID=1278244 RepID=UPI0022A81D19|nr:YHYH protein [Veronia nyctiphanis]